MNKEKEYVKEEIRKEFQVERMIIFSDAVFAIVITLMAIELRVPDGARFSSDHQLGEELLRLLPNFTAYTFSFLFIGFTWYQHLQVFSLLKDFDKGLVFRNLLLLFFIGLFPFSVSIMARPSANTLMTTVFLYFSIIILCKLAQLNLHHYILVKRPQLRINADIKEEVWRFKKTRLATTMLFCTFFLLVGTSYLIPNPDYKFFAWWWFMPFPLVMKYYERRLKKAK